MTDMKSMTIELGTQLLLTQSIGRCRNSQRRPMIGADVLLRPFQTPKDDKSYGQTNKAKKELSSTKT
jgi:hypothetical protein